MKPLIERMALKLKLFCMCQYGYDMKVKELCSVCKLVKEFEDAQGKDRA